ncbi:hypothetical protein BT96DRAFT_558050 [Gymnopus androsaceus JB14]|uniref:Uncharacterized protein n=1 Tax=Gymnopus androsaceus JB14 TaxID=1447944 RepID=A0A6A4HWH9_9AGAR|nr:hypothetical protein BT96DRAFT_558050 [Gymnopus androsaceus JB14]
MGQSQSKANANGSKNRESRVDNVSNDGQEQHSASHSPSFSTLVAKRRAASSSRRSSSLRSKAVRNSFFKSKTESEGRVKEDEAETDMPESSGHRSAWRRSIGFVKSRRWSKTPGIKEDDTMEGGSFSASDATEPTTVPSSSSSSPELATETSDTIAESVEADLPTIVLPIVSAETDVTADEIPDTSIAADPPSQVLSILSETETSDSIAVPISVDDSIPVASDTVEDAATTLSPLPADSTATPARPQFPSSGTLVVVQGVVHTTDVPIPTQLPPAEMHSSPNLEPSSSLDDTRASRRASTSTLSGPRDRLSALLRRSHESRSTSRPASAASVRNSDSVASEDSNTNPASEEESITPSTPLTTPPTTPPQPHNPLGSISSSSIDVLGTLLSVAAAATAASLLTGSSDPVGITSPPPPSTENTSSTPSSSPSSPMFPPTASTSNTSMSSPTLSPRSIPVHAGTGTAGDRDRAERMRHVWSNIRNRLSLGFGQPPNRRHPAEASADVPLAAEGGGETAPLTDAREARERMLNEIARAFNLGLSSSPSPSPSPSVASPTIDPAESDPETVTDGGLPLEGTFERFLVDLQMDLRGVLSGEGIAATRQQQQPTMEPESGPETSAASEQPPQPEDDDADDDGSMPSLQTLDSDDDSDAEDTDSTPPALSEIGGPTSPTGNGNNDSGTGTPRQRINYWRLYRFPPIAAPRAQAAAESVAQNMRSGLGGLTRAMPMGAAASPLTTANESESGVGVAPSSLEPQDAVPNSPNANANANANVVVPVIVVGLQSVNAVWTPMEPAPAPADGQPSQADAEAAGARWPSRAANALRSLRRQSTPTPPTGSLFPDGGNPSMMSAQGLGTPPAGMTSQGTQTQLPGTTPQAPQNRGLPMALPEFLSAPGSRTFLIYVIGG